MKNALSQSIFNVFIWLLMLVPFFAIITQKFLRFATPFMFIAYGLTIILGISFLMAKKKNFIPKFLWLLIPYFFYKYFVDFNYNELCKGSFYLTLRQNLFVIATFFGLLMIFNSTISGAYVKILNKYILAIIIVAPIFTTIQIYDPFFMSVADLSNMSNSIYSLRRYSFFGYEDPNALGFTYLPLVFSFIGIHLLNRKRYLIIYLMCIGEVLILSNTRYVMFGFILVFLQLILSNRNRLLMAFRYLLILLLSLILFSYFFNYLGYNLNSFYNIRLDDKTNILARVASFNTFIKIFPQYLVFGIGDEKSPVIINELHGLSPLIHVGYLNHLVVYGLLGSFFLFGFWIGLFKWLYYRARKTNYWAGVMALFFFFWANLSLYMYSIFFSGLLLCLISERYYALEILKIRRQRHE